MTFLMKIARTFMKAKIIQRVKPSTLEEIQSVIEKDNLLDTHGGSLSFNIDEWFQGEMDKEKQAQTPAAEKKKKKIKDHQVLSPNTSKKANLNIDEESGIIDDLDESAVEDKKKEKKKKKDKASKKAKEAATTISDS